MKTVLITGSNSAVGIAVAEALADHPVRLALHYHANQAKAEELKATLDSKNIESMLFRSDLTQPGHRPRNWLPTP